MWDPADLGSIPPSQGRKQGAEGSAFPVEQRAESYMPFQGKRYKNKVSGNPSAPPRATGGGQVTSSLSVSPGWDGFSRTLSGNRTETATEERPG